jgi:hypothetical protein
VQLNRLQLLALAVVGGAAAIAACSTSMTVEGGGSFGRAGGIGPAESSSTGSATQAPRCPSDPPTAGASCPDVAVICTFGPDVRDECVEKYECNDLGRWVSVTGSCQVQCPEAFAAIAPGAACGDHRMTCSYDEGTCGCFNADPALPPPDDAGAADGSSADGGDAGDAGDAGKDGGFTKPLVPGVWKCVPPPGEVICPSARPRVLDACVKQVSCDYGTCELGRPLGYACLGSVWVAQQDHQLPECEQ